MASNCLGGVAIILEADFDPVGEAGGGDLVLGPGFLLARQCQADDFGAAPRSLDRQTSPAAADFEQSLAGLKIEPVEQGRDLVALGLLERVRRCFESRATVGHRLVEPGRVEIVAEVVMGRDVGAGLARRVVAQAMGERVDPPERALGAADVAQRHGVGRE